MAVSNPSDFFIPQVSLDYARQSFEDSLELLNFMGPDAGLNPSGPAVAIQNNPVFNSEGQTLQVPVFKRMTSLVADRDITSNSNTTPVKLDGTNEIAVKKHYRVGPVDFTEDAARLSRATPEQISAEIGRQAGEEMLKAIQASVIAAMVGSVAAVTASAHTKTLWAAATRTNFTPQALNSALQLMAEKRADLTQLLMRSETWQDLGDYYLGQVGSAAFDSFVRGGNENPLGKRIATVDSSRLTTADAGFDKYHTLVLGGGAVRVWFTLPMVIYPPDRDLLPEQVLNRWRADFDIAIGVKGMQWGGGNNPTDANLATSGNWTPVYSNHKEVKIVLVTHNYSGN